MSHEIKEVIEQHGKAVTEFKASTDARIEELERKSSFFDSAITEMAQKGETTRISTRPANPLSALSNSTEVKAFAADRSRKSANVPIDGPLTQIKAVVGDVAGAGNDVYN